jgi:hypothetical protein
VLIFLIMGQTLASRALRMALSKTSESDVIIGADLFWFVISTILIRSVDKDVTIQGYVEC